MKSEQEIREKLEKVRGDHAELMRESGASPCQPDGSADANNLAAISAQGELSMLEWVLEE